MNPHHDSLPIQTHFRAINLTALGEDLASSHIEALLSRCELDKVLLLKLPFFLPYPFDALQQNTEQLPLETSLNDHPRSRLVRLMMDLVARSKMVNALWLPHIQQLNLTDIEANAALLSSIVHLRHIRQISIGCVPLGVPGSLKKTLEGMPHLETLEITEFSGISSDDLAWLSTTTVFSLKSMRIGSVSSLSTPSLHAALTPLVRNHAHTLRQLMIVDESTYQKGFLTFLSKECPSLKKLAIFVGVVDEEEITAFCSTVKGLEAFVVQSQPNLRDAHLLSLLPNNPHITAVGIAGSSCTDASLVPLIQRLGPQLLTLDLEWVRGITDVTLVEIAKCANRLKELDLGGAHPFVTVDGLKAVFEGESVCASVLEQVGITNFSCSSSRRSGQGAMSHREVIEFTETVAERWGGSHYMIWRGFTCRKYPDLAQTDYEL
ncbi:hypothetical protein HDU93_001602 [Gonapodya sp. JEL0774]|nr:hypothetical protein HDU93_001602 [Gonapodya sp. JEL0774]